MEYSSIQVSPRMRARLARYKQPGMSYEDVLEALLAMVSREEFATRYKRAEILAREAMSTAPEGLDPAEDARIREERGGRFWILRRDWRRHSVCSNS